jgi:hypothetical protein
MRERDTSEFVYTVEARRVGAGQTIWRWEIRRRGEATPVLTSVSLQSREAAEQDAVAAIRQRCAGNALRKPRAAA